MMPVPPSASRGNLLIADDEEFVRHGLAELLRRDGFTCEIAASGSEALARMRTAEFDALISDIHMPGNVQLETIAEVRAMRAALPVIILTGRATVETAAKAVRLPVTAYLTKPPNMDELVAILDQAVLDYRGFRALEASRVRLRSWEREIAEVEQALRAAPGASPGGSMSSYLRLTLRQVIQTLAELEQTTAVLERTGGATAAVDHEAALRKTVEVLERTKQNFKSKELADLRKQIEGLLGRE